MKKISADRIVSISAIVVSVGTLIMILYQTSLMRQEQQLIRVEQKASVMPSLAIGYGFGQENDIISERIWLTNRGLGPAFIEEIVIIDGDNSYETDLYGYFERLNSNKEAQSIERLYSGRIIPSNDGMTIYEKQTDSTSQILLSSHFKYPYQVKNMPTDNPEKAIIEITYKSVYNDRWKIRSDRSSPIELEDN